jgi:hypothetical protein
MAEYRERDNVNIKGNRLGRGWLRHCTRIDRSRLRVQRSRHAQGDEARQRGRSTAGKAASAALLRRPKIPDELSERDFKQTMAAGCRQLNVHLLGQHPLSDRMAPALNELHPAIRKYFRQCGCIVAHLHMHFIVNQGQKIY